MKRRTFLASAFLATAALTNACANTADDAQLPKMLLQPRALAPRGLALVLGSGGPRGFAQVGALKALAELNVVPDLVVGSSVGAVLGALLASHMSADDIERKALELSSWDILDLTPGAVLSGSFFTARSVARLTARMANTDHIEALSLPFAAAATRVDMQEPQAHCFNSGDLRLAIQASAAVVGKAPPVEFAGMRFSDGDLAAPLPVRMARELGAKHVIAVDVTAYAEDMPAWVPERVPQWLQEAARREAITTLERPHTDVLLHLRLPYLAGFSVEYRKNLIALGYEQTMQKAKALLAFK